MSESNLAEVLEAPVDEPAAEQVDEQPIEATGEEETSPPEGNTEIEDLKAQLEETKSQIDAFKSKAVDETGKRQAIEQQFQALQSQVTANQISQEKPDFWENPEQALSAVTSDIDRRIQQVQTNTSVQIMRSLHDDYNEMEAVFVEAAQKNPSLVAQMNQSDNPAKFAYDYGKTQQQMAEFADPDAFRAKIEAEVRAKIEQETKDRIEEEIRKTTELPGSLSTERGVGASNAAPTARPELEKVLGE